MNFSAFIVNPEDAANRGSVERAVWNLGGTHIVRRGMGDGPAQTDTTKASRRLPMIDLPDDPQAAQNLIVEEMNAWVVAVEVYEHCLVTPVPLHEFSTHGGNVVFMLGSEARGLPKHWQEIADDFVTIPMARSGCMNVATAAALCLWQVAKETR